MVLYDEYSMRPDNSFVTVRLVVLAWEDEYEYYVSKYAETCERIENTTRGYQYEWGTKSTKIYIDDILSASWDSDYTDWSGTLNIKIPYKKKHLDYIHKGAYVRFFCNRYPHGLNVETIRKDDERRGDEAWEETERRLEEYKNLPKEEKVNHWKVFYDNIWSFEERSFHGFITDIKYNPDSLELTVSQYPIVLEEEAKLSFKQMYRSDILNEVIYASGMIPNIDMSGLPDEVIDWSNISSNTTDSSSNGNTGDALTGNDCTDTNSMACLSGCNSSNKYGSGHNFDECCKKGYAVKDTAYYNWARQYSTGEEMLKALRKIWEYNFYRGNLTCPQKLFNTSHFLSNCYDAARLVKVLCDSIGFPCVIVTGYAYGYGHGWNVIKTGGQWLSYDLCFGSKANSSNSTNTSMLF